MDSIQNFSTGVLAEIIRRQPASKEKTVFAWQIAVGPALARATTVTLQEDGVLFVISRDERWAKELNRAKDNILRRMQHLLGPDVIRSIRT